MGTFESRASLLPVSISGISPGTPSHEDGPFHLNASAKLPSTWVTVLTFHSLNRSVSSSLTYVHTNYLELYNLPNDKQCLISLLAHLLNSTWARPANGHHDW